MSFAAVDSNHDGVIDQNERAAAVSAAALSATTAPWFCSRDGKWFQASEGSPAAAGADGPWFRGGDGEWFKGHASPLSPAAAAAAPAMGSPDNAEASQSLIQLCEECGSVYQQLWALKRQLTAAGVATPRIMSEAPDPSRCMSARLPAVTH